METRTATVVAVTGREAQVALTPISCARCQEGRGCGAGLLAMRSRDRLATVDLAPGVAPKVGDAVVIPCAGSDVLSNALLAFGLPLVGLLVSAATAQILGLGDKQAVALSLAVLVAAAAAGARLSRQRVTRATAIAVVSSSTDQNPL